MTAATGLPPRHPPSPKGTRTMSHTPESPDPDDLLLSGRDRKGELRRPDPGTQVPYGRVLHSAALLGLDPAVLVSRLEALGYADIQQAGTALPDTVRPD